MSEVNGFQWAANTLKAPRYMTLLARLFGKQVTGTDDGFTAIGYHFRGVTYMVDFIAPAPKSKEGPIA